MVASLKIVRTYLAFLIALVISVFSNVAPAAYAESMHMDIRDGDSSFFVDTDKREIWWITDVCRHSVPVQSKREGKPTKTPLKLSSDRFSKDVQIGSHRFTLEQQFSFDMVSQVPTLQVYNSLRGGWSEVDIRVDKTCDTDFACRQRMELPLCVD